MNFDPAELPEEEALHSPVTEAEAQQDEPYVPESDVEHSVEDGAHQSLELSAAGTSRSARNAST